MIYDIRENKQPLRLKLQADIAAFLAGGGEIRVVEPGFSGRDDPDATANIKPQATTPVEGPSMNTLNGANNL